MRRLVHPAVLLPLLLAAVGVGIIIAAQLEPRREPAASVSSAPSATRSEVAAPPTGAASAEPGAASAEPTPQPSLGTTAPSDPSSPASPTPSPSPTRTPLTSLATQLAIDAVGINVTVRPSTTEENDDFPDTCCAFILRGSSQPGRNTNSYLFAHALPTLFKPLWNVQIGDAVRVAMDDGTVLEYTVTEVRPNVPCPDANPPNPELNPEAVGVTPPLVLQYAPPDCAEGASWTTPTDHERLTLQTSQGYNRNWGELVVIAEPAR